LPIFLTNFPKFCYFSQKKTYHIKRNATNSVIQMLDLLIADGNAKIP